MQSYRSPSSIPSGLSINAEAVRVALWAFASGTAPVDEGLERDRACRYRRDGILEAQHQVQNALHPSIVPFARSPRHPGEKCAGQKCSPSCAGKVFFAGPVQGMCAHLGERLVHRGAS